MGIGDVLDVATRARVPAFVWDPPVGPTRGTHTRCEQVWGVTEGI